MTATTFPRFSSFPLELRRKIYLLATPPRIVHVQEETEDQEEFEETLRTTPVQLKLDPSLAHFAFNWHRRAPFHSAQKSLESCGITVTGNKASEQPWEPSAATPEIPLHWLADHPSAAWELLREGELYSKAPIPTLLHTCAESRAELISCGYQLAFRTRSSRPVTWFNFDRDVLYIDIHTESERQVSLLSSGLWDFGQFHPEDLKRVRKLALKGSGHMLSIQNPLSESALRFIKPLSGVLRLLPGIKELLLVEWTEYDVGGWSEFSDKRSMPDYGKKISREQDTEDTPKELWHCVAIEEIDAMLSLITPREKYRTELYSTGTNADLLKAHKQENGGTFPYFQSRQLQLEQWLLEQRDTAVSNDISFSPWKIPKVKAVHILPPSMANFLSNERQSVWMEFSEMKRKQQEVPTPAPVIPAPISVVPCPRPASPPLPFTQDEEDAFNEAHYSVDCCGQCEYYGYQEEFIKSQKSWWVEEGMLSAPKDEIIY